MEPKRSIAIRQQALLRAAISLVLLAPCYWQPRLQAGDISSHIYKSWLAHEVESGRTQGVMTVKQTTSVLFDLMLSGLFGFFGAEGAQRIAVSIAVLTFVWGAFAFIRAVSGKRPWHLLPCIAMLAYGWVFHMGFFNFYLSMGMCLWAMSLAWSMAPHRIAIAAGLLALAYVAHALPVVWASGLLGYYILANRISPEHRGRLSAMFLLVMAAFHFAVGRVSVGSWPITILTDNGVADQLFVFNAKYFLILAGLLIVWALLFLTLVRSSGARQVVGSLPFHMCVLGAAAVLLLPGTVLIPGFTTALSFVAERMSLGVAVCVCALLGGVQPRAAERYALIALAIVFFGFVYRDERALNAFEDRMQDIISVVHVEKAVTSGFVR